MKRYDLLLALNGIISAASDTDAAEIMLERTEALHKQIKAEEELAVEEGWIPLGLRGREAAMMFCLTDYDGASEPVTVTIRGGHRG